MAISASWNDERKPEATGVVLGPQGGSDVIGRRAFAFAARQREGRLALWLREPAGQLGEGLDEGVALGDAHLPQLHLLPPSPLLRHLVFHLPTLPQVALVAQHDDCDLRMPKDVGKSVAVPEKSSTFPERAQ